MDFTVGTVIMSSFSLYFTFILVNIVDRLFTVFSQEVSSVLLRILRYFGSSHRRCNVLSSVAHVRHAVYVVLTDGVMFCPPLRTYVTLFTLSSQTSDRVSEVTGAPNRIFVKEVGFSFPQFFFSPPHLL